MDKTVPVKDYTTGISEIAGYLRENALLSGDLAGVGHRVVHGAEAFRKSVVIDENVMKQIENCSDLAPLHNPANLAGIKASMEILPDIPQIAVFDTAFFHTLEPDAYMYALPYKWYTENRVRRYGFHGTSHKYVSEQAAKFLNKPLENCNLITMHLGNGCSMAAVKDGRAVNTTMGLTPLEGLVMGTRCGDIDPAIVFYMLRVSGMDIHQVHRAMEKESGLLGVSCVSGDMRDIFENVDKNNERAELAAKIFARRVRKYIGAYMMEVGELDALVFTGGIGENAWRMRKMILENLDHMGIIPDDRKNESLKLVPEGVSIQSQESQARILVIPTNEELAIAKDTGKLVEALMHKV